MKQKIITINTAAVLLFLTACNTSPAVAPSKNSALNNISKSNASKQKEGAMQKALDSWLESEWIPTISQDKEIQQKYMKKSQNTQKQIGGKKEVKYVEDPERPFKLQEYVDKASAYIKAKPNNYENSNVHKLESMPVIGKQ
jgi:hypothetical protein